MSTNSITITFSVKETARADVLFTNSRAYYRFATIDTCEEGEIPCNNTLDIFDRIISALTSHDAEPMPHDVMCSVTISNEDSQTIKYNNNSISQSAYNSLINIISQICTEFMFIRGFK